MLSSQYAEELAKLESTYAKALGADVERLKIAVASASEASILGVGSGGSFTVASFLCNLHEFYTGRVSRASTPLEIICNPTLASASPVFLISAEGRNPDAKEALLRARRHSARPIHVLTNHAGSPLLDSISDLTEVSAHLFELGEKDGYLATNSLLFDSALVARAYNELDKGAERLPDSMHSLMLRDSGIDDWLAASAGFVREALARGLLIVTFSPLLRPVAVDLESRLAESALLYCQLADLRSFAHGRHLWLAERPGDCAVLALVEPSLKSLWDATHALLPPDVPSATLALDGSTPRHLLAGIVAEMKLVGALGDCSGRDPGRPNVPSFGRELHYAPLPELVPTPREDSDGPERTKYEVLGASWPSIDRRGTMRRAVETFTADLERQVFRALVVDYDGTLCSSQRRDSPPATAVVEELIRLLEAGVILGVATGRGGSIDEHLQAALPKAMWNRVKLGLYNAGAISQLGRKVETERTSEFLSNVVRILGRLKAVGVPIERIRPTHPFQVSVRFREGADTERNWFVIADALRQAGLDLSRIVRSRHSIDILAEDVNKSHLVADMIQEFKLEPYQVLAVGDQGAWPGNDASLLEHRFSLSVDVPSRRLDRGWKLAPQHKRCVDATLWYLARMKLLGEGGFRLTLRDPST